MPALTISTPEGIVTAERSEDGATVTIDVLGSSARLTRKEADLLADYLTPPKVDNTLPGDLDPTLLPAAEPDA